MQRSHTDESYQPVRLVTNRGDVACRFYEAPGARHGAVWVGGAGGGWDTPARNLYPRLCQDLLREGVASLRVRFRNPRVLDEAVHDVQAGLAFLRGKGVDVLALVGHSFGGAVVIQAAEADAGVRTVVALATQSYGAEPAAWLGPRCSVLLLHGTDDEVLPASCSRHVYHIAQDPKHLILYPGTGHVLNEAADEVHQVVRDWILSALGSAPS